MKTNYKNVLFLNQMAGPLFRELAEDLSNQFEYKSELYTGHPDTLNYSSITNNLVISSGPTYNRENFFSRIFSWFHYSICVFFKLLKISDNTLIFLVSNPPLLGPVVYFVKLFKNINYVVLVYDIHPDTLISFNVLKENSIIVNLWKKINRKVYESSIAVYTIGDVMALRLEQQFDVNKTLLKSVGVIPPWADTNFMKPINKLDNPLAIDFGQDSSITVLYSGNMGISHDIESMLEASKLLKSKKFIKFLFIGAGEKWNFAYDYVKKHNLKSVQVLPFQPEDNLPFSMALGDISLVSLDQGAEGLMVPSKMFYYMAVGSAVIAICEGVNDLERFVTKINAGIIVKPGCPNTLAKSILKLAENKILLNTYKSNSRIGCVEFYSRTSCMNSLIQSLKNINLIR